MIGHHQQTAEALSADLYTGAKLVLLTGDGTLQERLTAAYCDMAVHAVPLSDQLPGSFGHRIAEIHRAMTGGGVGHDASDRTVVAAAVDSMAGDERIRVALDVVDLADDLDEEVRAAHVVLRTVD